MALPKIQYPVFDCILPSTKKKIEYRQMLVKEEKILLMAKLNDNEANTYKAVKQVVNACVIDDKFDIDKAPIFDIEYLFIKIRSASVNNISKVAYRDLEDDKVYDFEINLEDLEVKFPEKVDRNFKVSPKVGFSMNYPSGKQYDDSDLLDREKEKTFEDLVAGCIDKIFEEDVAIDASTISHKELVEFVEGLDIKTYDKVREFLVNSPRIFHTLSYTNTLGKEKKIVLNTLSDFFTFA